LTPNGRLEKRTWLDAVAISKVPKGDIALAFLTTEGPHHRSLIATAKAKAVGAQLQRWLREFQN
jgi:hypothetical protein